MADDPLKAIIEVLAATKGQDPLELSPDEAAVAAKLLAKLAKPQDPVRSALGKITGEMMHLLLDAACMREEDDGTLNLIKRSCASMFSAWIEEEGEERIGNLLGAYYVKFEDQFKGSDTTALEKGKAAVNWLLEELELQKYASDNPLLAGCGEDNCVACNEPAEDEDEDLVGPF